MEASFMGTNGSLYACGTSTFPSIGLDRVFIIILRVCDRREETVRAYGRPCCARGSRVISLVAIKGERNPCTIKRFREGFCP